MPLRCSLRKVLDEKDVSQAHLASSLGITPNEVYLYASERREPRGSIMLRIARHLGLPVESIWHYEEPKRRRQV